MGPVAELAELAKQQPAEQQLFSASLRHVLSSSLAPPPWPPPAKQINVFLRIVRRREDGYHDLASLFHVIDLGALLLLLVSCLENVALTVLHCALLDCPPATHLRPIRPPKQPSRLWSATCVVPHPTSLPTHLAAALVQAMTCRLRSWRARRRQIP